MYIPATHCKKCKKKLKKSDNDFMGLCRKHDNNLYLKITSCKKKWKKY